MVFLLFFFATIFCKSYPSYVEIDKSLLNNKWEFYFYNPAIIYLDSLELIHSFYVLPIRRIGFIYFFKSSEIKHVFPLFENDTLKVFLKQENDDSLILLSKKYDFFYKTLAEYQKKVKKVVFDFELNLYSCKNKLTYKKKTEKILIDFKKELLKMNFLPHQKILLSDLLKFNIHLLQFQYEITNAKINPKKGLYSIVKILINLFKRYKRNYYKNPLINIESLLIEFYRYLNFRNNFKLVKIEEIDGIVRKYKLPTKIAIYVKYLNLNTRIIASNELAEIKLLEKEFNELKESHKPNDILFLSFKSINRYISLKMHVLANKFPSLELIDTSNSEVNLKEFRKNLIVITFWGTWCEPCIKDLEYFLRNKDKFLKDCVNFIFVALENNNFLNWKKFIEKKGIPGINLYAENGFQNQIIKQLAISYVPFHIILDMDFNIIKYGAPHFKNIDFYFGLFNKYCD